LVYLVSVVKPDDSDRPEKSDEQTKPHEPDQLAVRAGIDVHRHTHTEQILALTVVTLFEIEQFLEIDFGISRW
jgi:hypothetical protein